MQYMPQAPRERGSVQAATSNLIVFDLRTLARFQDERPYVQVLSDIGAARVALLAFRAGQRLPEHPSPGQALVQALRGRVTVTLGQRSVRLQAGLLLRLEAGVLHSIAARTDALVLLTIIPTPSRCGQQEQSDILSGHAPLVARTT